MEQQSTKHAQRTDVLLSASALSTQSVPHEYSLMVNKGQTQGTSQNKKTLMLYQNFYCNLSVFLQMLAHLNTKPSCTQKQDQQPQNYGQKK